MARCGCQSSTCACAIRGGSGVVVTGKGTPGNEYYINIDAGKITVDDTPTIDMKLIGSGTSSDYYHISANATIELDELTNVTAANPAAGNVLAWDSGTGQWKPTPPVTATPGAVNVGVGLSGDGSATTPLIAKANQAGGIAVDANGIGLQSGILAVINSIGSWRSYTPKLYRNDTGAAVGISGTPSGRYILINKLCICVGSLTCGSLCPDACVSLPVAAATRELNIGSLVNYGSTGLASDQSGAARILSTDHLDRMVLNAFTNGFRDAPSGSSLTWSVTYETG